MKRDILIFFNIILIVVVVILLFYILGMPKLQDITKKNSTAISKETVIAEHNLTNEDILAISKTQEVQEFIRGSAYKIILTNVTPEEIKKYPGIYGNNSWPLYRVEYRKDTNSLLVIMNSTKVLNVLPLTRMGFS